MKKECEIIRDIFPNYVDNEVSNSTREFVENHIKACTECTDILNSLLREKKYN